MNIRRDDTVVVLSGKDKGKKGKVLVADPKNGKVIVEGVNVAKRHRKARKQGEESAIVKKETPIYASKVMRVCPQCDQPTRLAHTVKSDGSKVRVCKKCGKEI
jgi:large subunit ribosomal protein L24